MIILTPSPCKGRQLLGSWLWTDGRPNGVNINPISREHVWCNTIYGAIFVINPRTIAVQTLLLWYFFRLMNIYIASGYVSALILLYWEYMILDNTIVTIRRICIDVTDLFVHRFALPVPSRCWALFRRGRLSIRFIRQTTCARSIMKWVFIVNFGDWHIVHWWWPHGGLRDDGSYCARRKTRWYRDGCRNNGEWAGHAWCALNMGIFMRFQPAFWIWSKWTIGGIVVVHTGGRRIINHWLVGGKCVSVWLIVKLSNKYASLEKVLIFDLASYHLLGLIK